MVSVLLLLLLLMLLKHPHALSSFANALNLFFTLVSNIYMPIVLAVSGELCSG